MRQTRGAALVLTLAAVLAPAPAPVAEDKVAMPVDKAVVYGRGEPFEVRDALAALSEGVVVVADAPDAVKDKADAYLKALVLSRLGKGRATFPAGSKLSILATGPMLDSPDDAAVVGLTRQGEALALDVDHTSARAEGRGLRRNIAWRPLAQAPVDLPAGSFLLTAAWRATTALTGGKALDVKPAVSTFAFTVEEGRKESKTATIRDVEFRAYVQGRCVAPAAGESRPFDLGLRITNTTDKPLLIKMMDCVWPKLKTADGKDVPMGGGRDGTRAYPPVTVAAGDSFDVSRAGRLERPKDGAGLRLAGVDPSGFFWNFDGLRPGKYRLSFHYENGDDGKDQAQPYWVGKAETEGVEFEVVEVP